jgi:hypothetical protein
MDSDGIHIGGGGEGDGLLVRTDLNTGHTSPCLCFRNPPLTKSEESEFDIACIEVYGLK